MASLQYGLTPPHGRGGHSVPIPRPLNQFGPIYVSADGVRSAIKPPRAEDASGESGDVDSGPQVSQLYYKNNSSFRYCILLP